MSISASHSVQISGFTDCEEIGSGAMSVVYRGTRNEMRYAIKVMRESPGEDSVEAMLRFRREAAALARLSHKGLVRVHEAGEHDGRPYIVMDLLDGQELEQLLKKGPLSEETVIQYAKVLAGALGEVHRRGMIHRDFKPANIIVGSSDMPRIIDFGFVAGGEGSNAKEQMIGSFLYAAPEQGLLTAPVDGRADLYALGAVLFACLSGRAPFLAATLPDLLAMHARMNAPDVRELRPETSQILAEIIAKLLEKAPAARYQTGEGLLYDLEAIKELEATRRSGKPYSLGLGDVRAGQMTELPLIGRDAELTSITTLWTQATQGKGAALSVEGEGGCGKTRLVRELLSKAKASHALILSCKCQQGERVPYGPLREALDDYASRILQMPGEQRAEATERINRAAGSSAPIIRRLTRGLEVIIPEPRSEQGAVDAERFYGAVAEFFVELARLSGSAVMQVDDVQWLDEATLQVLIRIARQLDTTPLMLGMTARNDSASEPALNKLAGSFGVRLNERLVLKPLGLAAVSELVAAHLGGKPLEGAFVEKLATRSNGNPFVIGEYVRTLLDNGVIRPLTDGWTVNEARLAEVALPTDVLDLVTRRVAILSESSSQVLRNAAVVGMIFNIKLVKEVSGEEEAPLIRSVREAIGANLVEQVEQDQYGFVHDRVREALLSQVTEESLKDINQRIAEALDKKKDDSPGHIFALTRHYLRGRPERAPQRVSEVAIAAGTLSLMNFSNQEAYDYLMKAMEMGNLSGIQGAALGDLQGRLGTACMRTARVKEAIAHLEAALTRTSDAFTRARYLIDLGRVNVALFNWEGATKHCQSALVELGQPFPKSKLGRTLSTAWFWFLVKVLAVLHIGFGTARGRSLTRNSLLAETYSVWSFMIFIFQSSLNKALIPRLMYVAYRLGPRNEAIEALSSVGVAGGVWYPKTAVDQALAGVRFSEQLGDRALLALAKRGAHFAYQFSGNWKKGEEWGFDIRNNHIKWMQARDMAGVCNVLGENLCNRGYAKEGADVMRTGVEVMDAADLASGMATCRATLAANEARLGSLDAATNLIKDALTIAERRVSTTDSHTYSWICQWGMVVCLERGDYGDNAEQFIQRRESYGRDPEDWNEMQQHYYIQAAWLRLRQLQTAAPADRARRREQVDAAVGRLERIAKESLKRSNARIVRAVLAREDGRPSEAEALLVLADAEAKALDGPLLQFEVAVERARLRLAARDTEGVKIQAELAVEIASKHGWKARIPKVRSEFGLEDPAVSKQAIPVTAFAPAVTPVGSGSMVLTSHGRPDRYLRALLNVSLAAQSALDPALQARAALDEVVKVLSADRAYLFLRRADGSMTFEVGRDRHKKDLPAAVGYSTTVVRKCVETRRPFVLTGTEEGAVIGSTSAVANNLRSIIAAPLMLREEISGVVYLDNQLVKGLFNEADADLLQAVANHIAIAFESGRTARMEIERREMEKDLELSATVQSFFLPRQSAFKGNDVEVVGYYRPAGQCSGDWWSYELLPDQSLLALVGDVTGHGAGPAMITATTAACYRTMRKLTQTVDAALIVSELSSQILDLCNQKYSMSMSAVQIYPDGRLCLHNAGGLPPFVLRKNGTVEMLNKPGELLGSSAQPKVGTAETKLEPGDRAFAYTDGLPEMVLPNGRPLGLRKLTNFLKMGREDALPRAAEVVVEELAKARGNVALADDVTFILMERR